MILFPMATSEYFNILDDVYFSRLENCFPTPPEKRRLFGKLLGAALVDWGKSARCPFPDIARSENVIS